MLHLVLNPFNRDELHLVNVMLLLQAFFWGLVIVDSFFLPLFGVRQLYCFLFLSLVPGVLLLRVLHREYPGPKYVLYAIGLSISVIVVSGFLISTILPYLGFSRPLSLFVLLVTITLVINVFLIICRQKTPVYVSMATLRAFPFFAKRYLALFILPLLAIIGTFLVNTADNNLVLLCMILVIGALFLAVFFGKIYDGKDFAFILWIFSISVILHDVLISYYLNKYDVNPEFYFANIALENATWSFGLTGNYNTSLAITILAPVLSILANIDLLWVFKLAFPFLLSLVPVGLYLLFKDILGEKGSFMAVFYFISFNAFYFIVPSLGKQIIAELFLVLILLELFSGTFDRRDIILLVLFTFLLVTSHYGTSFLVFLALLFAFFCAYLATKYVPAGKMPVLLRRPTLLNFNYICIFGALLFTWFYYISSSSIFGSLISIGSDVLPNIFSDFLDFDRSRGLIAVSSVPLSPLHWANKILQLSIIAFMVVGLAYPLLSGKKGKISLYFYFMGIFWLGINIAAIAVSGFAVMNPTRLYHLSLFILGPFIIIGLLAVFSRSWSFDPDDTPENLRIYRVLALFFLVIFLFNAGFVYEVAKDHPNSLSLSQVTIATDGTLEEKGALINVKHELDVASALWLAGSRADDYRIYATKGNGEGTNTLVADAGIPPGDIYDIEPGAVPPVDYVYLNHVNREHGVGLGYNSRVSMPTFFNISDLSSILNPAHSIYDNGAGDIYLIDRPEADAPGDRLPVRRPPGFPLRTAPR